MKRTPRLVLMTVLCMRCSSIVVVVVNGGCLRFAFVRLLLHFVFVRLQLVALFSYEPKQVRITAAVKFHVISTYCGTFCVPRSEGTWNVSSDLPTEYAYLANSSTSVERASHSLNAVSVRVAINSLVKVTSLTRVQMCPIV